MFQAHSSPSEMNSSWRSSMLDFSITTVTTRWLDHQLCFTTRPTWIRDLSSKNILIISFTQFLESLWIIRIFHILQLALDMKVLAELFNFYWRTQRTKQLRHLSRRTIRQSLSLKTQRLTRILWRNSLKSKEQSKEINLEFLNPEMFCCLHQEIPQKKSSSLYHFLTRHLRNSSRNQN